MTIEMRTYRLKPGSIPEATKRFGEAVEASGRSKISPLGAFFHTEVGPLNRIIHCWPYESLAAREKLRAEAMKLSGWPPPIGEFIESMEAKIINLAHAVTSTLRSDGLSLGNPSCFSFLWFLRVPRFQRP